MKIIKVISKTKPGEEALKQHFKESLKLRLDKKLVMRQMGIVQSVETDDPYTVKVEFRNTRLSHMIKPKHIKMEIVETLEENGAKENQDYTIEVE